MSKLKETFLKDISVLITKGTTPTTVGGKFVDAGINFIKSESLNYEGVIDDSLFVFIDEETNRKLKRSILQENDILYSIAGAYLGKLGVVKREHIPANTNQACAIIRLKHDQVDYRFIKHYLSDKSFINYVNSLTAQSAQPNINLTDIGNLKLLLPPLDIQKKVSGLLSSYDELVEINSRRIKLLEETAIQLYKEWFVRMRFPGYKKVHFEKGIPEGWEHKPIGKVIDYNIGGGWGNDKQTNEFSVSGYVIRGTDIPAIKRGEINKDVYRFHKASNMKSRELKEGDIVFETAGGSEGQLLGRTCFISQETLDAYGDKIMAASFCKQIRTASIPSLYLYYFLNYLYETGMIETFQVQSTGISNYQFEPFLKFQEILLPKDELMQAFHDKVMPIHKQIATLGQQNSHLRQIRDRLLPRLISGKLTLKERTPEKQLQET